MIRFIIEEREKYKIAIEYLKVKRSNPKQLSSKMESGAMDKIESITK